MRDERKTDRVLDEAVRRYLQSEAEKVDAPAFLGRLKESRRLRAGRIRRFPVRVLALAAAAAVLLAAGILFLPRPEPTEQTEESVLLAFELSATALRDEAAAAWGATCSVGRAALGAGTTPLLDLREVGTDLPEPPDPAALLRHVTRGRSALERILGGKSRPQPPDREENEP